MSFGRRVQEARKRADISQETLARRADMSLQGIARIEQGGTTDPHFSTLRKLAEVLKVSPLWLATGEEVGEPVNHLRGKDDEMPAAAARIDAAREAAGPQSPPVARIIEKPDKLPLVLWYIPEEERAEWREDLETQYPGGYLEEDGPAKIEVDRTTTVKALA